MAGEHRSQHGRLPTDVLGHHDPHLGTKPARKQGSAAPRHARHANDGSRRHKKAMGAAANTQTTRGKSYLPIVPLHVPLLVVGRHRLAALWLAMRVMRVVRVLLALHVVFVLLVVLRRRQG